MSPETTDEFSWGIREEKSSPSCLKVLTYSYSLQGNLNEQFMHRQSDWSKVVNYREHWKKYVPNCTTATQLAVA